jgi:hypothetical protein
LEVRRRPWRATEAFRLRSTIALPAFVMTVLFRARAALLHWRVKVAAFGTTRRLHLRLRPTAHLIAEFMVLVLRTTLPELLVRHG